jgi:hypothetical protein
MGAGQGLRRREQPPIHRHPRHGEDMSDYTPVHMYSGVMACIAQVLREGAISALECVSVRICSKVCASGRI